MFGLICVHTASHHKKSLEDKNPNSSAPLEALRDSYIVVCIQLEMDETKKILDDFMFSQLAVEWNWVSHNT